MSRKNGNGNRSARLNLSGGGKKNFGVSWQDEDGIHTRRFMFRKNRDEFADHLRSRKDCWKVKTCNYWDKENFVLQFPKYTF